MMIRNWTFLPTLFPPHNPSEALPVPFKSRVCLHFQWEGKEVSRLLIVSFVVFSRKKKKKIEATTPALLCRDWILGGDPAKDYWGGAAPCRVCTHKKANALIAQSCFTQKVWLVPNKAPNDSFFSFSFTLTPSRAAYDFFNSLRNILLEHQFVNY